MRQSTVKSSCRVPGGTRILDVEVCLSNGLPYYQVVGLGDSAVRESGQRVKSALKSCGFFWPQQRVTVNLSPAWLSKKGTTFDLAIALGILQASGQIPEDLPLAAWGELGLSGEIKSLPAALCYAHTLSEQKDCLVIQPEEAEEEISLFHEGGLYAGDLASLGRCLKTEGERLLKHGELRRSPKTSDQTLLSEPPPETVLPVYLQEAAWRAMIISASAGHHLWLAGAAGCGKTTLASAARYLLPPLSEEERYEQALNYSLGAQNDLTVPDIGRAAFRAPHFSVTGAALLGGSIRYPLGELALADRGILFLDEISEYSANRLNLLRQPLEEHYLLRHRDGIIQKINTRFILLAASNPCPCGLCFEEGEQCSCSEYELLRYQKKFNNPFFDRIDLYVEMLRLDGLKLRRSVTEERFDFSADRKKVEVARTLQWERLGVNNKDLNMLNAWLPAARLKEILLMDQKVRRKAEDLAERFYLSIRGFHQLLRVSRTIADLEQSEKIKEEHVLEAFTYKKHREPR